jgi:putative MFS transporter
MALLGILIGSPIGGWAADKFGRRPLFFVDISLFVVASLAQVFAGSFELLIIIRFVMGIAIGAEYSVGWPMLAEFTPPHLRGRLMATVNFAWYSGFAIGYTVATLATEAGVNYKLILGSSTVIAVALLIGRIGLPESARWLWNVGRHEEARRVTYKYIQNPDEEVADLEREVVHEASKKGFKELFSSDYIRATVFVSWFWFCNVLPYFGIATFAGTVLKQFGIHGLFGELMIQVTAVAGVVITMMLIDKAGRRVFTVPPQWIILGIFLILGLWSGAPATIVLALFFAFAFLNAVNGVLTSVYPGEVFPTEVRGVGTGFAAAISRLGAATGVFLLPIGIESLGIHPVMLILAAIVASGAIVSQLWAPETKGKSLSETAAGFSH